MKAYGLPRRFELDCPDVDDILRFGLKSSIGSVRSLGDDFRGLTSSKTKKMTRRYWKKAYRGVVKNDLRAMIREAQ